MTFKQWLFMKPADRTALEWMKTHESTAAKTGHSLPKCPKCQKWVEVAKWWEHMASSCEDKVGVVDEWHNG